MQFYIIFVVFLFLYWSFNSIRFLCRCSQLMQVPLMGCIKLVYSQSECLWVYECLSLHHTRWPYHNPVVMNKIPTFFLIVLRHIKLMQISFGCVRMNSMQAAKQITISTLHYVRMHSTIMFNFIFNPLSFQVKVLPFEY